MSEESQVNTDQGVDQGNVTPDANQSLGWIAALPDDQKQNDFVKTFTKPGDFVKTALEIKTERDEIKGKLGNAIFKPDEKATPEQVEAYYRSIGKPEKATDYNFPVIEGMERDPKFTEWAQNTFHQIGVPKEMGEKVAAAYDNFAAAMVKAQQEADAKAKQEAEAKVKAELGDQYPVALELTKRMLADHATPEEKEFLAKSEFGNSPLLARLLFKFAKKTGEDVGLQSSLSNRGELKPGIIYDKSPNPPQT
jgi:hypothetical protein